MKNKCKQHPQYKAISKPRSTTKYPDGCPDCWKIWTQHNTSNYVVDIALLLPQVKVKATTKEEALERANKKLMKDPIKFTKWATNITQNDVYVMVRKIK